MKITCYIEQYKEGYLTADIGVFNDDGRSNPAVNFTLISFIFLLTPELRKTVMALLASHEAGTYHPEHSELADFSTRDINMWIRTPFVEPGHVLIANENTGEYSKKHGTPQCFTVSQFRQVMVFWEEFLALVDQKGEVALLGQKFEREFR